MTHNAKRTIVLVHGASADSSSWNGSVTALLDAGHHVIAVANPLRSLEGDAAYLRSVLDSIEGPIVVAGHSYGGVVMSHAADGHPAVTALVYVASVLAEPGESLVDLVTKFPGRRSGRPRSPSRTRRPTAAPPPTCTSTRRGPVSCSPATSTPSSPSGWPSPSDRSDSPPSRRRRRGRRGRRSSPGRWPPAWTARSPPSCRASWPSARAPTSSRSTRRTP
ncbi:alpha/beta fold hydrolase [Cellulomonas phragmiteti]|uniref:alpha/beta fold hydrolase n=1 Tax=Cellulomonas phragmiteti TaxID=478780 RepID=UPI003641D6BF